MGRIAADLLDTIVCSDNATVMQSLPDACIDLTVTSPPYDNLRAYKGFSWDFEAVAQQLYRVTKPGGVVVWVIGDATVKGSETGTSFKQALRFMEIGFNLHDTMIWNKPTALPRETNGIRYEQGFEFMFVLSKCRPKITNLRRVPCKRAGTQTWSTARDNHKDEQSLRRVFTVSDTKVDTNVWTIAAGGNAAKDRVAYQHPAIFPEALARDHILSWSNPGDLVLDPFCGSGTTCKMAVLHDRHYLGIELSEEYCAIARQRVAKARADKEAEQQQTRLSL